MSDSRTKRERFLPFAYDKTAVRFDLQRIVLDGGDVIDELDRETHLVDLRGSWRTAELFAAVTVPREAVARLVPAVERDEPPLCVAVAVRCPATHLRRGVVVPLSSETIRITLARDELAGSLELVPFLARTRAAAASSAGHATQLGARVASGRAWTIRVDLERPPAGHHLDIQFKPFSQDLSIPARERGALWRLEATSDQPILWLNADHREIATLLMQDSNRGRRAELRDVVFDRISASVWTQLFLRAARAITPTGEGNYAWEEGVLDVLLPQLYPTAPTRSARITRLQQELDDIPDLVARLDAILQTRDDALVHLGRLVEDL